MVLFPCHGVSVLTAVCAKPATSTSSTIPGNRARAGTGNRARRRAGKQLLDPPGLPPVFGIQLVEQTNVPERAVAMLVDLAIPRVGRVHACDHARSEER